MNTPAPVDGAHFDAIVVGAGYGGVTSAAVLASRGLRVLLVDKNAKPGGKAMPAARRDGITTELWPVSGGPTRGSRFDDLIKLVGLPEDTIIAANPGAHFCYLTPDGRQLSTKVPSHPIRDPLALFKLGMDLGVKPWQMHSMLRMNLVSALLRGPLLDHYDNISMADYLQKFDLPAPLHHWICSLMNLFFVVPVDQLPVSEAILTLRAIATGGAGRYHKGGYGSVAQAAVDFLQARGGTWLPSTRVTRIRIENGKATGIETSHGTFHAPVILSNAGIQPTVLKLVGEQAFAPAYVKKVRELKPSWAFVGVRYDLPKPVFDVPMNVYFSPESGWDSQRFAAAEAGHWPQNPLLFVIVPSVYDPSLVNKDVAQVALVSILCSPDPASPMNAAAIQNLEAMVDRLWPDLRGMATRRREFGAEAVSSTTRDNVMGQGGECIGLGQMIGQCGRSRPDIRSPVRGLYFVGADAGGRGIGTTMAVDSGYQVAHAVLTDVKPSPAQRISRLLETAFAKGMPVRAG